MASDQAKDALIIPDRALFVTRADLGQRTLVEVAMPTTWKFMLFSIVLRTLV